MYTIYWEKYEYYDTSSFITNCNMYILEKPFAVLKI